MTDIALTALKVFNYLALIYFALINSFYFFTSLFSFGTLKRYAQRLRSFNADKLISSAGTPPVTLLTPVYNEEDTCVESIRSLLTLNYPDYEIIMINDGSADSTLERMVESFDLEPHHRLPMDQLPTAKIKQLYHSRKYPNLWLIDKENGGKSDALNAGLNYCRTPFFCALDADTLLERDSLLRLVRPILENDQTIAAGGILRIINGCKVEHGVVSEVTLPKSILAKLQVLEYLRAFLFGRVGWDAIGAMLIVSGAFGMFKRSVVVDAGGYSNKTVGEDMELIVRLHERMRDKNQPYKIAFIPEPVAWTECPESLSVLGRQRDRWQRGLWQSLSMHIKMLFNPKYGKAGLLAFPYYFFLEMFGPVIEFLGYIAFIFTIIIGEASALYIGAFFMLAFIFGVALSISAVGLEELTFRRYIKFKDFIGLFYLAVLENFGFRQYLTYCRFRGTLSLIFRRKSWGKMKRKGFKPRTETA